MRIEPLGKDARCLILQVANEQSLGMRELMRVAAPDTRSVVRSNRTELENPVFSCIEHGYKEVRRRRLETFALVNWNYRFKDLGELKVYGVQHLPAYLAAKGHKYLGVEVANTRDVLMIAGAYPRLNMTLDTRMTLFCPEPLKCADHPAWEGGHAVVTWVRRKRYLNIQTAWCCSRVAWIPFRIKKSEAL